MVSRIGGNSVAAPRVGIVVVEYRDRDGARRITAQAPPSVPVVVVSAGPIRFGDDSDRAIVVHLPTNPGFGAAANQGIKTLPPDVTHALVCNTDIVMQADTASRLAREASVGSLGLLSPVLVAPDGRAEWNGGHVDFLRLSVVHEGIGRPIKPTTGVRNTEFVTAACVLICRAAWMAASGFREDLFLYSEDVDFSLRLRSLGWWLGVAQEITVTHRRSGTVGVLSRLQLYLMTRNGIRIFREWGTSWWSRTACWLLVPVRLAFRTLRARPFAWSLLIWIARGAWDARDDSPYRIGKGRSPMESLDPA